VRIIAYKEEDEEEVGHTSSE